MPRPVCVVHVGTHKTGTTALQYFLQTNIEALKAEGLLFSRTGWYGVVPGNHNVAWDLVVENFNGHVAQLAQELRECALPAAIISAEDLSLLIARPQALQRFVSVIEDAGYQTKILIYLREQAGLVESIYAERVKHGDARPFAEYVRGVLDHGAYTHSDPPITFDYQRIVDGFARVVGDENVLARPYIRANDDLAIFHDFLAALEVLVPNFRAAGLKLELHHPRINESLTFGELLARAFIALRPSEGLPEESKPFFDRWAPEVPQALLGTRFSLLTFEDRRRIFDRFKASNDLLAQNRGIVLPFAQPHPSSATADASGLEQRVLDRAIHQWRTS